MVGRSNSHKLSDLLKGRRGQRSTLTSRTHKGATVWCLRHSGHCEVHRAGEAARSGPTTTSNLDSMTTVLGASRYPRNEFGRVTDGVPQVLESFRSEHVSSCGKGKPGFIPKRSLNKHTCPGHGSGLNSGQRCL